MKILKSEERGNMLVVTTDFKEMPEFVYELGRFEDLAALKAEIMKKASEVTFKKRKKDAKKQKLKNELDKEVKDNA